MLSNINSKLLEAEAQEGPVTKAEEDDLLVKGTTKMNQNLRINLSKILLI